MSKLRIVFERRESTPEHRATVEYECVRIMFINEPEQTVMFGYFEPNPASPRTLAIFNVYRGWQAYATSKSMFPVEVNPPSIEGV